MIKFLHAADLHMDSPFAALRPEQAIQRRQEQRALVGKICAICRENECDLLLLPGDLFDGGGVYLDTLDVLRDELCECGAQVFIAPGNHDFIAPASPYLTQAWPENVHIFTRERIEPIVLRELGCAVWGAAFTAPAMPPLLRGFRVPEGFQDYVNLMVLHGDAPFYILDEPFTQVDPVNIEDVKAMIRERARDHGVIITDHNYDAISSVADNLFVIADGYTNQVRSREDLVRHGYLRVEE